MPELPVGCLSEHIASASRSRKQFPAIRPQPKLQRGECRRNTYGRCISNYIPRPQIPLGSDSPSHPIAENFVKFAALRFTEAFARVECPLTAMWPYLIICDFNEPERYTPAVNQILEDWGAKQVLRQSWLLNSDLNAQAIVEMLRPIVRRDDRLMVMELAEDSAAINVE